jgi:hypothetical protein
LKTVLISAAFVLAASAATACPWAGKAYNATIEPSINFEFTFDATCDSIVAQRSGKEPETVALQQIDRNTTDHGWYFKYDLFEFLFRVDGERADARQGGARRPMNLREK